MLALCVDPRGFGGPDPTSSVMGVIVTFPMITLVFKLNNSTQC